MARMLLALYLAIMFGPLALAVALWTVRDALKAIFRAKGEAAAARTDGSEEGLQHTVEEVRANGG